MTRNPKPDLAQKIVEAIESDLSDHKGLGDEWEQIDPEILDEIRDKWAKIIRKKLKDKQ